MLGGCPETTLHIGSVFTDANVKNTNVQLQESLVSVKGQGSPNSIMTQITLAQNKTSDYSILLENVFSRNLVTLALQSQDHLSF